MSKYKTTFLASAAVIAIATATVAGAADLGPPLVKAPPPPAPVFSWTGCYGGAHVGWGWGQSTFTDHSVSNVFAKVPGGSGTFIGTNLIASFPNTGRSASVNQSGAVFGGQLGCDYQFGGGPATGIVVGISGSAAGADINGTNLDPNYLPYHEDFPPFKQGSASGLITSQNDFLADISGRLGLTWSHALFYVKGGIAWTHDKYTADTFSGFSRVPFDHVDAASAFVASSTVTGGLFGAGIEWAITPNWSAFAEYDHYFFPTKTLDFTANGFGAFAPLSYSALVDVGQRIDTVKVGVNYRFSYGSAW